MSRTISASSGKPYGVARVCRIWDAARATLYRHRRPDSAEPHGGADRQGRWRMRHWSSGSRPSFPPVLVTAKSIAKCGLACALPVSAPQGTGCCG